MLKGETILDGAPGNDQDPRVSGLKVLRSGAGWYIGTVYIHDGTCCPDQGFPCNGMVEPYSRETGYFPAEDDAEQALQAFIDLGTMPADRRFIGSTGDN